MKNSVPFIDLKPQHRAIRRQVVKAVTRVFDSQQFILKDSVLALEKGMAAQSGTRHAIAVNSGSDALLLSLLAVGVGPGDEVITTPFTFFATAGSISRTGAKPVFVDIDPVTFNLDPKQIEAKISRHTKAIIPVHLFGLCCDMKAILAIARRHSLSVVEDACQSYDAAIGGKKAGSFGDTGCFSFYPTKNLGGAGDGGMIVTSSAELADRMRLLRDHGSRKKYHHELVGMNSRLDEIQAAVLLIKLKSIRSWNRMRQRHADRYNRALAGLPICLPSTPRGFAHVWHLYSILTRDRDALSQTLAKRGIGSGVYYPLPLHLQSCYRALGYRRGDLPNAERACKEILSLPMYPEMPQGAVNRVSAAIRSFYRSS